MDSYDGPPPGSAEYLSMLLTGPDFSCPHPDKLQPSWEQGKPNRLGFFQFSSNNLSYLDTHKVCKQCYDKAVPDGFLAWSGAYNGYSNVYSEDFVYPEESTAGVAPASMRMFPAQIQAGTENFFIPQDGEVNWRQQNWDRRPVFFPKGPEPLQLVWDFFKWAKWPIYIDLLHLHPPYREYPRGSHEETKEDERVNRSNAAAYLGARYVVLSCPDGGIGPNTILEHRLGSIGSYRLMPLTPYQGMNSEAGIYLAQDEQKDEAVQKRSWENEQVAEVDPFWEPNQMDGGYKGDDFSHYANDSCVSGLQRGTIGNHTSPDATEQYRRAEYENRYRRPTNENGEEIYTWNRPPDVGPSNPESSALMADAPRISMVTPLTWDEEQNWKRRNGFEVDKLGYVSRRVDGGRPPIPAERAQRTTTGTGIYMIDTNSSYGGQIDRRWPPPARPTSEFQQRGIEAKPALRVYPEAEFQPGFWKKPYKYKSYTSLTASERRELPHLQYDAEKYSGARNTNWQGNTMAWSPQQSQAQAYLAQDAENSVELNDDESGDSEDDPDEDEDDDDSDDDDSDDDDSDDDDDDDDDDNDEGVDDPDEDDDDDDDDNNEGVDDPDEDEDDENPNDDDDDDDDDDENGDDPDEDDDNDNDNDEDGDDPDEDEDEDNDEDREDPDEDDDNDNDEDRDDPDEDEDDDDLDEDDDNDEDEDDPDEDEDEDDDDPDDDDDDDDNAEGADDPDEDEDDENPNDDDDDDDEEDGDDPDEDDDNDNDEDGDDPDEDEDDDNDEDGDDLDEDEDDNDDNDEDEDDSDEDDDDDDSDDDDNPEEDEDDSDEDNQGSYGYSGNYQNDDYEPNDYNQASYEYSGNAQSNGSYYSY